jgi:hypothetical protein
VTSDVRVLIELGDLIGLELECPSCQAKVLYPLAKTYDRIIPNCPNCNEMWFAPQPKMPQFPSPMEQVQRFITKLAEISTSCKALTLSSASI